MSVCIVTDSTSDLPQAVARSLGIDVIPLSVLHRGKAYLDGIDITPDEFYPLLAEGPDLPTTSQPTPLQFENVFMPLLQKVDHIISIHISGGLSSTVANARAVAERIARDRIHVVDSGFLSYALAFQAIEAAGMARCGATVEQILKRISHMKESMELLFTLDTLHYLYKGGRIGKVSSLLGNLLNIKPVIRVENGIYVPAGKSRSVKQSVTAITQYMVERFRDQQVRIAVGHGRAAGSAKMLLEQLSASLNVADRPVEFEVGPVIGVHTGPGTLGAAVYPAV